jgi:hypothetical protein
MTVTLPAPSTAVLTATRLQAWLVHLIAAHSAFVGAMLLIVPAWSVAFAGWTTAHPLFFARQGGVFHLVVAFGYLVEHRRCGTVTLLVFAKTAAFLFLILSAFAGEVAWVVPFSGVVDGAMGATAFLVHRAARAPGGRAGR